MHSNLLRKVTAIIGAIMLGAGVLGGAAMAAVPATGTQAAGEERDPGRRAEVMGRVLHELVGKGVITKDQAEQILRAFDPAAGHQGDGDRARRFLGNVMQTSADYLGLTGEQLKEQLKSGKSLARIAAATPGKSRDGLIATLTKAAEAQIKAAVAAGTLTPAQAEEARTKVTVAIVRIVDREPEERTTRKTQ